MWLDRRTVTTGTTKSFEAPPSVDRWATRRHPLSPQGLTISPRLAIHLYVPAFLERLLSSEGFMPHGHCYLWDPGVLWTMAGTDLLIGAAYVSIALTLHRLVRRIRLPFSPVLLSFGVFIGACGATHLLAVLTLWYPAYRLSALVNVITTVASVATALWLLRLRDPIARFAEAARLSEQRRVDLEALTQQLEAHVRERNAALERTSAELMHQSQERQRVSNLLTVIATSSPDVIYVKDARSRLLYANPAALQLLGKPEAEVLGRTDTEILGPGGGGEAILDNDRAVMGSGQPLLLEEWVRREGVARLFASSKVPYRDEAGRVIGLFGISRDITERKEAEEAQRRAREASEASQAQLRAVFDAVSDGLVVTDMTGRFVLVNEAEARMVGYESSEAMKQDLSHFVAVFELTTLEGEIVPVPQWPISRVLRGEAIHDVELCGRRRDTGQCWTFSFSGQPVRGEGGEQLLAVIVTRDITEQKRAQRRIEEAVVSRDNFLTIASHELKTPLTSMKLQLATVARALGRPEGLESRRIEKLLMVSDRQIGRLTRLIEDMLDASRIHSGPVQLAPAPVDLADLLQRAVEHVEELCVAAGGRVPVPIDVQAEPLRGRWDPLRLEQSVANLLSNAVKYGAGRPIRVRGAREGDQALISVQDQGIGIDKEHQARIFERFERAVGPGISGLGVGLFIARRLVEAHGGTLQVESEPGEGATFTIRLPLAPPAAPPAPELAQA